MSGICERRSVVVALDERYRWKVDKGVLDYREEPAAVGVGIDKGRTIMNTGGWVSMDAAATATLGYRLLSAAAILEQQGS